MSVLKKLALILLSLLLFLSLFIFGFAFMLNVTLLNPGFVTSEVDRLDFPSLVEEITSEPMHEEELPEEIRVAMLNTITELEPLVKEQVSAATYSIYDYLLGKSQSLDLALTLSNTIFNPDFVVSLVNELNIAPLAVELLSEQIAGEIPENMEYLVKYLDDDIIAGIEAAAREQISDAAEPILDYLLGESRSLNLVISLEPITESLKVPLREAFLESPPAELAHLPRSTLEQYFDEYFVELAEMMPSTFKIDESLLGTELPAQLAEALAEAEEGLKQARQYISYFQLGYKALIGFMLLLVLGIILISREVRKITLYLGINFLVCGVFWIAGIFIAKHSAATWLSLSEMPLFLQAWMPQFLNNLLSPLQTFSLVFLIAGIALIVVSFLYKPSQSLT